MKRTTLALPLALLTLLAPGCGPKINHSQAIYMQVDTSGTYAKEVDKAEHVIKFILGNLNPGDTLAVGRVKSRNFTE